VSGAVEGAGARDSEALRRSKSKGGSSRRGRASQQALALGRSRATQVICRCYESSGSFLAQLPLGDGRHCGVRAGDAPADYWVRERQLAAAGRSYWARAFMQKALALCSAEC
jgi:hypothetical protein